MGGYYILIGLFMLISMGVSSQLKRKFAKYSKTFLANGMSGREIAEKMLADNGITDVQVISTPGQLTDHYNPANKTVNLSEVVYHERNAAAAAVAAHEVGHAVQHAVGYNMLQFRSKMVPMVNIASNLNQWILMLGIAVMAGSGNATLLWIGIALFAVTTVFALVTLPVEYDASNRALAWFQKHNMLLPNEYDGAKDSLKWAARTYLVAAISSLTQLIYFVLMAVGGGRNNE
ncbi:zinc metallopeptidase [Faecalibacter bovis]|uniref:Zinc metallopeptidase n=1 Tax=Faecalibacter bovis TaxID=2898187 RepID=A0ABX7XCW8_9FLAO|nr:zinc metallopeptidase [Faecalibacter bovis]MBS7333912.1 zinc metallopeptidase [Weeksellaceae bacterium]QTV05740.1 zinc metallopeptidase [Faecalibacter bovis]